MIHLNLMKGLLLGFIVFFWMTQSVSASELLIIPRSQEQEYCPVYFDTQFCSIDGENDQCAKGIEMIVKTPTPKMSINSVKDTSDEIIPSDKPPSLNSDLIFEMINNHRVRLGLQPFEKEERLCALARERGPELYDEIFVTGNIHGGFNERNLPWWITENMKYGASEEAVFNWWLGSSIHRKAIEGDFVYSCGECYGNSCAQLFTSYTPK